MSTLPDFMHVADNLTDAAVALESTVISHGLPYPHNIQLALRLEEIVRAGGASPATIGIIAGKIVVGLDRGQIEHLATAQGVRKVSRRDLPIVVARKLDGATTVATTSWAAHRAGIRVFATGGIGGVHRTGVRSQESGTSRRPASGGPASSNQLPASSFLSTDISADLPELAANAHPRRLRGGEGDPGSAGDAGMAGDARGDGGGLRHGPFPRVLQSGQRPAGGRARRHARGGRGVVPRAAGAGAAVRHVGDRAHPGRVRAAGRSDGSRDHPGAGRGGSAGDQGQGDDPIPAGPRQRADGRSQPAGEPGAAGE